MCIVFTNDELATLADLIRKQNHGKLSPSLSRLLDKVQKMRLDLLFSKQHSIDRGKT